MENLTAILIDGVWCVEDANGGVWWPDEDTAEAIAKTADPYAEAIRVCEAAPTHGEWRD